jgi:hypothetical protein
MKTNKIKHFLSLLGVGILGPLALFTMDMSHLQQPEGIDLSIQTISFLNSSFLLLIALVVGILTFQSAGFNEPSLPALGRSFWHAHAFGLIAGLLIICTSWLFMPFLPKDFLEMGAKHNPSLLVKLFYGGITEEILMRFGLMSVITWILIRIARSKHESIYWMAIIMTSIVFGLAHLPIALSYAQSSHVLVSSYVLIGNGIGGIIFGYVYWKYGISYAMIAHAFTHVVTSLMKFGMP